MLRIISALVLLSATGTVAYADDMLLLGVSQNTQTTYQGPGDIVSGATAWYGLRAYNSAYATGTNNAINIRRASDNTTSNIVILSSGALDTATAASFAGTDATASCSTTGSSTSLVCTGASSTPHSNDPISGTGITQPAYITSCGTFTGGAGTCTMNVAQNIGVAETVTFQVALFVTEAYDQSGNGGNITQATAGSQPQLLPSGFGNLPGLLGGQTRLLTGTMGSSHSIPYSYSAVATRYGISAGEILINNTSFNPYIGYAASANTAEAYCGNGVTATASDGNIHSLMYIIYGSNSSYLVVDGNATTSTSLQNRPTATAVQLLGGVAGYTAIVNEVGLWGVGFTLTQYGNMHTNQSAYWSTP